MKQYVIVKTATRYEARNINGNVVAFVEQEFTNIIRVDYEVPYGWETKRFAGDLSKMSEKDISNMLQTII